MKRIFVAMFAVAYVVGQTPAFAADARGGPRGSRGMDRGVVVEPPPRVPNMQSRIPAPLPPPAQAPVIKGPVGSSGLPPMGNAR
ncbi:MAG: hypothetical protein GEU95_18860 [Rhizobiales bacterium]|nr:hypothetical protein [Hyphomicrobiales bacterium]